MLPAETVPPATLTNLPTGLPLMAKLSSAVVTPTSSELIVEVDLHLDSFPSYRLVKGSVRYISSTPSIDAIKEMVWAFPLQSCWLEQGVENGLQLNAEGIEKTAIYYKECTRHLFKRRPWIPDQKAALHNHLTIVATGQRVKWETHRRIGTTTHESNNPPREELPPSAPDD